MWSKKEPDSIQTIEFLLLIMAFGSMVYGYNWFSLICHCWQLDCWLLSTRMPWKS